jgi:uncharacterized protein (DUF2141 family)
MLPLSLLLIGAAPAGELEIALSALRSGDGQVRLCLTRDPAFFPDCKGDPQALLLSAPAAPAASLSFTGLPSGDYAVSVFHDENGNGRLDTFARIPREGFGFSRNPAIRFGPPRFAQARFAVAGARVRQNIHITYIL